MGKKVMLNALQFMPNSSGIGLMLFNLYNSLAAANAATPEVEYEAVLSADAPSLFEGSYVFCRETRNRINKNQNIKRKLYELFALGIKSRKADVFISRDSDMPLFTSRNTKKILIVTDIAVYRMGEVYKASRSLYWRFAYRFALKKADRIMAISEFTKNELIEVLKVPAGKIDVMYIDGNSHIRRINDSAVVKIGQKHGLGEKYILFVGNFNPRKNLVGLIKAFELLKIRYASPHKLVIVGEKGWKFNKEQSLTSVPSIREEILFPGYIADEEMPGVYCGADLLVLPSLYEGFGMPVIEAQRCGVPVVASDNSCFREIAGEGALFADPFNTEDICDKMYSAIADEQIRKNLIEKGYNNEKRFSWLSAGKQLAALFS